MVNFIGRQEELKALFELRSKNTASLVVIRGRRRIGKSRLINEFAKNQKYLAFSGLPPIQKNNPAIQREAFGKQLQQYFQVPIKTDDWWDLLWFLAERTSNERVIIFFDEISWLGYDDEQFLGKLKTVWDTHFSKNAELILIMCGSISSWIDKNILSSSGFLGRITLTITLRELPLAECNLFWGTQSQNISSFEKLKVLAVTGGVPRYLEDIRPAQTAEQNLQRMGFDEKGIFFDEFENIFSDLFDKRSTTYKKIVAILADGRANRITIAKKLGVKISGILSEYLEDLQNAGFITREYSWCFQNGIAKKTSFYRLLDNYTRFYLKYILPNKNRIIAGAFKNYAISTLPAWSSILGLQFENLVLQNRAKIKHLLGLNPEEVSADGPYFQTATTRSAGCQVDYLIQTKFNNFFICEIKFSNSTLQALVIDEVKAKIANLKIPRGFSYRPVLIHVNGVSDAIIESNYFATIIDFGQMLTDVPSASTT